MLSHKKGLTIVFILIIVGTYFYYYESQKEKIILKIFHAGSLTEPLEKIEKYFESKYPNVNILREPSGSIEAIRKLTDLGLEADVIAVADYSLIPKTMFPDYADWYIMFAKNRLVLAYNDKSKYRNEINDKNWFEILRKENVRFGFSNPNNDPCGYRALMAIQLSELYYNNSKIFDELIEKNTNIKVKFKNGVYAIEVPDSARLQPSKKVLIRNFEMELISALESGDIDYCFTYESVAKQNNQIFLKLPSKIDFSSIENASFYKNVQLYLPNGEIVIGNPIVYGVTIPKNALNKNLALEFVKLLISKEGQEIFSSLGQEPLVPAIAEGNLPNGLKPYFNGE
ncbi:MAG: tungstate ABC transporter substrate-binding protein WtpA [Candidatus Bathyarchaeia archaeon]